MSLYIDLSEFLANPIRTGIQRIAGEMCRHLPPGVAVPVRLSSGGYVALPEKLIRAIGNYFASHGDSGSIEIRQLSKSAGSLPVRLLPEDTVLVPEVFDNPERLAYFSRLSDEEIKIYRFIVFDLLPITHPEYFLPQAIVPVYGYFKLIRRARRCGFISEFTRAAYYDRLRRTGDRGGVVLPLGCDSLGRRADARASERSLTFSVVGTVEPRKNHRLILEAFLPLLKQIDGLHLSFLGRMGWVDQHFADQVCALDGNPRSGFRFHPSLNDIEIRNFIKRSKATIYISSTEGYGLPPVESLWAGTPVIASRGIPSLERLGSAGIHFVEPLDIISLRRAVLTFLDENYAKQKTEETAEVNLPTWRSFTEEVLRWCGKDVALKATPS